VDQVRRGTEKRQENRHREKRVGKKKKKNQENKRSRRELKKKYAFTRVEGDQELQRDEERKRVAERRRENWSEHPFSYLVGREGALTVHKVDGGTGIKLTSLLHVELQLQHLTVSRTISRTVPHLNQR
jgi:hypothetical protein